MIANPQIPAFRYDPYTKRLTRELYDHEEMRKMRGKAVEQARDSLVEDSKKPEMKDKEAWGIVLGTLGRQGNLRVLKVNIRTPFSFPRHSEANLCRFYDSLLRNISNLPQHLLLPLSPIPRLHHLPLLLSFHSSSPNYRLPCSLVFPLVVER